MALGNAFLGDEWRGQGILALGAEDWQTCRDASEMPMACVRRYRTN